MTVASRTATYAIATFATLVTMVVGLYTAAFSNSEADQIPNGIGEQILWWLPFVLMIPTVTGAWLRARQRALRPSLALSASTLALSLAWYAIAGYVNH